MDTDPFRPCYVYLLKAGEAIKIGIAVNVGARMAALQSGNHMEIVQVGKRRFERSTAALFVERELHAKFESRRAFGEWFNITTDEAVQALKEYDSNPSPVRRNAPVRPVRQAASSTFDYDDWIDCLSRAVFIPD